MLVIALCMSAGQLTAELARKPQEQPVGRAVYQRDSGAWRFLFVQTRTLPDQGPSWSIVDLLPGNTACLVSAGSGLPESVRDILAGRAEA